MVDAIKLLNKETGETLDLSKKGNGKFILDDEGISWGNVEASIYTYKSPNQIGNEISGVDIESRTVMVTGWLYGSQKQIESGQFWLGNFVVPGQMLRISVNGYFIEGQPQQTPVFGSKVKENNEYMCKFVVTVYCGSPEFAKESVSVFEYGTEHAAFHFPFRFVQGGRGVIFGIKEVKTIQQIVNQGVHSVGGIITFRCNGESLSNPKIFNVYKPDEFIVIDKTMVFGEEIRIDTRPNKQSVVGIVDKVESDYFKYWNFNGTWLQFERGDNYYAVTCEGEQTALEVSIEIVDSYYTIEGM